MPGPRLGGRGRPGRLPRFDSLPGRGARVLTPDFQITTEPLGDSLLIRLAGAFDLAAVGSVERAVDVALRPPPVGIVFDLRHVTFLDMAALRTVLRADQRARAASVDIRVVPPVGRARRVFTLTRVGDRLTLVDDVSSAAAEEI